MTEEAEKIEQNNIADSPRVSLAPAQKNKKLQIMGVIVLCFLASFAGSWVMLRTGLVQPDAGKTISENREKIVLQEGEIVSEVAKKVGPSAVSITTEAISRQSFFGTNRVQEGAGSGIIISSDGYILTNKHVVPEGTTGVTVTLSDGTEYTNVKVIGRDPSNDLAFLKIDGAKNLKAAELGNSTEVEVGEKVIAVGNALGEFKNTVTSGIISGIGRPLVAGNDDDETSETLENLFQTDAAINPGNSGGPLVDFKGKVIGINTAVAEQAEGIGFSIPINQAKGLIAGVLKTGKLIKPYLGVRYVTLDKQKAKDLKLSVQQGAYIVGDIRNAGVLPGSPAEKAGLLERDVIVKINKDSINQQNTLSGLLGAYAPGTEIELTIVRSGKEQTLKAKLEAFNQ